MQPPTGDTLDDPARLAALREAALLDTPAEEPFDRLARLARRLLAVPVAEVSFVDDRREYRKSRVGPDGAEPAREVPFSHSLCRHVVASGEELVASDLRGHDVLGASGAVTEDGVVACAAVPVRSARGAALGVLCVVDHEPRAWSDEDLATLRDMGAAVAAEVELRLRAAGREDADAGLDASRTYLESVMDSVPAVVYAKDLDGRYLFVNRAYEREFGLSRSQIEGRTDEELFGSNPYIDRVRDGDRQALGLAPGEHWEDDENDPRGDAVRIWRSTKFPLRDEHGEVYGVFGMSADRTEQIQTERQLAEARDHLRAAFEGAPIGMGLIAPDGGFLRVNGAFCEILARPGEEVLSLRLDDVVDPDDLARDWPQIERLKAGELRNFQSDARMRRPDGEERDVLINVTALGPAGRTTDAVSLQIQDITDRRRSERELAIRQQALSRLIESDATISAAPDILEGMSRLVGASRAELWVADDDGALELRAMWAHSDAGDAGREVDADLPPRVLEGGTAVWDGTCLCIPIRIGNGCLGVTCFVAPSAGHPADDTLATMQSITDAIGIFIERERTDADLARARDEALEASRMKSTFLANMSHEIRTPMNGVIGMTDLLLASDLSDEQRRWATTLRTSGRALLGIIDDILDFSKVEAGRLELERVCFDPREVVDATCDILAEQARAKGLALQAFIERRVPHEMWGDPGRLQQVLTNIMANAVKFTHEGGVTLRVGPALDRANALRFEVSDTGIGITQDRIRQLFEPFTQADSSTTRRFGGTGLGLTISRQLVELMGGDIGATGTPGKGTTFFVTLPLGRAAYHRRTDGPERRRPPAPAEAAPAARPGRCVLVVDDNQVNQMVAAEMLRRSGYDVDIAEDGRQAIAATQRRDYDAVLMDCQMPVMDGYQATREIRRAERGGRHVPIIALTSSSMKGDREVALAAGMDGFLAKPVTADALIRTVTQWTERPAPVPSAAPEPDAGPDLDHAAFTHAIGRTGLGPELARLFEQEARGALAGLRAALAERDGEDVARAAHGLKGSSSTLGAMRVASLAADIERAGREDRVEDAAALLKRLEPAVEAAAEALSAAARSDSG